MELEKQKAVKYAKLTTTGVFAFLLMFAAGYFIFPDGDYSTNFDISMNEDTPEREIEFDSKSITLGYNSSGPDYAIINGSRQTFELEGRQNEIFAVGGEVYMFYFESAGDYLRLLRIEKL